MARELSGENGVIQSVERAFGVLEVIARGGGELSLSEIAAELRLPAPSVYRLVRTLVLLGYLRQGPSRRYALAGGLIRLGESAAKQFGTAATPVLARMVDQIGESANMAILDGAQALYVAQVAGRHAMRMFTEVGRRVSLHSTGVGKALLSQLPEDEARRILALAGMPSMTDHTITDGEVLLEELAGARAVGYVTEVGEQEVGVSCVAVAVPDAPVLTALSFSAPTTRMTPDVVHRAAAALRDGARALAERVNAQQASSA